MEKRSLQRQEKKLKRPHSQKKHQNHLNLLFIDSSKEEEEDDKEKNTSFTWCEGRSLVFIRGLYKGQELSNVALCDTEYLKKALKRSDLDKKSKSLIKQALAKV